MEVFRYPYYEKAADYGSETSTCQAASFSLKNVFAVLRLVSRNETGAPESLGT